jgi:glycine/D-amino acid oxidase-like deaminating enzyme
LKNIYDIAVVGCGIAGASIVYQAKSKGLKTAVFEKGDISLNASCAAGAFLSPKFGPKSAYSEFVNRAFLYSMDFYRKDFNEFLDECGMLRMARDKDEINKCEGYTKDSPFWIKEMNGYRCTEAGLISPLDTIKKMVSFADFYENSEVREFCYEDESWSVGSIRAKHLVLASGAKSLFKEPYLRIKAIFGQKLEAKSKNGFDFGIHRKCSISPIKDGIVHIGASHIASWRYKESEELFERYKNALVCEAEELLGNRVSVIKESRGFRSSTADFFPYCGQIIDSKKTLMKTPNLTSGALADEREFIYHKNLWIHQGHGARGFVLAPYTAFHLIKQILCEKSDEEYIGLKRAFLRHARRLKA